MRLVVIILGFVLIAVGLFFAFREPGKDWAKGAGGRFSLEGPSWLLLVGIGALVVVFGAAFDFDDDDSTANATTTAAVTTTEAPDESSSATESTTSSDDIDEVTGCEVTIGNPLATIHEEPDNFSTEMSSVPAGTYPVAETTEVEFGQQTQRWFRIAVNNQTGWIRDSTFNIASKNDACFQ